MKTKRTVLIIIAIIVVLPFLGYFLWLIQKDRPLDLMIVNKTVTKMNGNEVKSLNWVLNSRKIVKGNNNTYDFTRDYYGFDPDPLYEGEYIKSFKLEEISTLADQYQGLIYLDNEGVITELLGKGNASVYGGLNQNDYLLLKEMIAKDKLIILEDNFFSEPTEDLVRFNTEQLLDVYSLHWKGKLFKNLDLKKITKEIGQEWVDIYENYYEKEWNFTGAGLILLNSKQSRILVLPSSEFMVSEYPVVKTDPDLANFYKLPESVPYSGWFQMVYEGKNQVISQFDLQLNDAGKTIIKQAGISFSFPAVIALGSEHEYFIAGDFSKQRVFLSCSKIKILTHTVSGICSLISGSPVPFFQNYYVPLMTAFLENYIASEEAAKTDS